MCLLEMEAKYAALDTNGTQLLTYVTVGLTCIETVMSDSQWFTQGTDIALGWFIDSYTVS